MTKLLVLSLLLPGLAFAADPLDATADWLKGVGAKKGSADYTVEDLKKLTYLSLSSKKLSDEGLAHLKALPALTDLDLSGGNTQFTGEGLKGLAGLKLKKLNLNMNKKVDDAAMKIVAGFPTLETLSLDGTSVTNIGLADLASLPKLAELDLGSLKGVTDDGLATLKKAPLTKLVLQGTGVTDAGLVHVKEMAKLKTLNLGWLPVDAGLSNLAGLKGLEELNLFHAKTTDVGAKAVGALTSLKRLFAWNTDLTDKGVAELVGLKALETLYLEGTKATDAAMDSVAKLPALNHLWIVGLPITDAGLAKLSTVKSLKLVQARKTAITDAGAAKLPGVKVNLK